MKIKHILLTTTLAMSISVSAQKDELKTLKKIYAKDTPSAADMQEYKAAVAKLETTATEEGDKVYTNFYKCMTPIMDIAALGKDVTPMQLANAFTPKSIENMAIGLNATLDYEKKSGKKIYTDDIMETITSYKPEIVNLAVALSNAKRYNEAGDVLNSLYLLDKKDTDKLFYSASLYVNGKDYDKALKGYEELKKINYSGESTLYFATNKTSKQEEQFGNANERDLFIKSGSHEKPRDEKVPSKRGEIYKNVALILMEQGKTNEAKSAITEARKMNPDDDSLILTEADLYLKLNDFDTYKSLVNEALAKNPNNADLVFNLGVISANAKKIDEAKTYYKRAIEIDPKYFNAYLNLSEVMLRGDDKYVDEMNKLGTSEKDNKRYEVLKAERNKNFNEILPYLEKAVELEPTNEPAKRTLLSVYNALEMTDKYKALKAKL
ncbi:tetratricopeptide repeat protein [Flavobacterium sp.]|uniref:tetratricopeptide repeat protein n=1 Tax=Flavobacterium sp. TaxID=239 RepID=UPI0035B268C6